MDVDQILHKDFVYDPDAIRHLIVLFVSCNPSYSVKHQSQVVWAQYIWKSRILFTYNLQMKLEKARCHEKHLGEILNHIGYSLQ